MIVYFDGTTPIQNADTLSMIWQYGPITGPYSPATITTPSGYVNQGTLTSGTSPIFSIAGRGGPYLSWYDNRTGVFIQQWQMDDEDAVADAMTNLAAAVQNEDLAVTLSSDGSVSVAS